jgi:hypothetical protein
MSVDDVVEFLTWLENVFPVQLQFTDKQALAEGFCDQRSHRIWREYERRRPTQKEPGQ